MLVVEGRGQSRPLVLCWGAEGVSVGGEGRRVEVEPSRCVGKRRGVGVVVEGCGGRSRPLPLCCGAARGLMWVVEGGGGQSQPLGLLGGGGGGHGR